MTCNSLFAMLGRCVAWQGGRPGMEHHGLQSLRNCRAFCSASQQSKQSKQQHQHQAASTPAASTPSSSSINTQQHQHHAMSLAQLRQQRKSMQSTHEAMRIPITGVTFEGRQDNLKRCIQGQPIQLTREPDNQYDHNAVHISTLRGRSLGYVPRDMTGIIDYPVTFGFIYSIGHAGNDPDQPLGAQVRVQPTLPSLAITIHPTPLRQAMAQVYNHPNYTSMSNAMLAATDNKCLITQNLPADAVIPRWLFLPRSKEVRLVALQPMCAQLVEVLEYEHCDTEEARARLRPELVVQVLESCNQWFAKDANMYLQHQEDLAARRARERYTVNMSLLDDAHSVGPLTPPGTAPRRPRG